jgi:hypothetical protein
VTFVTSAVSEENAELSPTLPVVEENKNLTELEKIENYMKQD